MFLKLPNGMAIVLLDSKQVKQIEDYHRFFEFEGTKSDLVFELIDDSLDLADKRIEMLATDLRDRTELIMIDKITSEFLERGSGR